MEGWKKAQEDYKKQPVRIQINDWTVRDFKNIDEYYRYLNKGL